ncbi:MAG: hypothetical protein ACK5NY_08740 [Burkholderiaceae bacterium]
MKTLSICIVEKKFPLVFETSELLAHTARSRPTFGKLKFSHHATLAQARAQAEDGMDLCVLHLPADFDGAVRLYQEAIHELPRVSILIFCDDLHTALRLKKLCRACDQAGWTWSSFERFHQTIQHAIDNALSMRDSQSARLTQAA